MQNPDWQFTALLTSVLPEPLVFDSFDPRLDNLAQGLVLLCPSLQTISEQPVLP